MQALGPSVERRQSTQVTTLLSNLSVIEKLPLAIAGGLILGLSSPGLDLWWCAWIGLASLLILIRACKSVLEAGFIGMAFGLAYHLIALRWILDLKPPAEAANLMFAFSAAQLWSVVAIHQSVLYAVFACLVFALPLRAGMLPHYHRPFFPFIWSVPIIWLFIMWVIAPAEFFGGLPIAQLAYSQHHMLDFLQLAKFGGSQLVDFFIVLFNCAVAQLIIEITHLSQPYATRIDFFPPRTGAAFDVAALFAALCLICAWGGSELKNTWLLPDDQVAGYMAPPIAVAVVQPDLSKKRQPEEMFASAKNIGVNMIFLPQLPAGAAREYRRILRKLATAEMKDVIVGLKEVTDQGEVQTIRAYTPVTKTDDFTAKCRSLPFFDYPPWYSLLVPGNVQKLLAGDGTEAVRSSQPVLLQTTPARIGGAFFNEILYPEFIARQAEKGAALVVHVADLTPYKSDTLSRQLIAAGVLRAIESGRYIVMAENGAVSSIIDPAGVRKASSVFGKAGTLVDRVQFIPKKTRYTSWWWIWTPFYRILSR
jgi:apolipoprotein N-acyltransferase